MCNTWNTFLALCAILTLRTHAKLASIDFRPRSPHLIDYRTNLCDEALQLFNNSIEFKDVLNGKNLTFLTVLGDSPFYHESASGEQSGFHYRMMELIADAGNFSYTILAVNYSDFEATGLDYTDWYQFTTHHFDLVLDWAMESLTRLRLGLVIPYGTLDVSIVLTGTVTDSDTPFLTMAMSFLLPFEHNVWALMVAVIIFTAVVYFIFEGYGHETEEYEASVSLSSKIYNTLCGAFMQFFGAHAFQPKTFRGKVVGASFSFFCLVTSAAYVANLATMLLGEYASSVACQDIASCHALHESFCVQTGTATYDWFKNEWPTIFSENLVYSTSGSAFQGLTDGKCDHAVVTQMEYDFALATKSYNSDCDLIILDNTIRTVSGGWIGTADYSDDRCSSVLMDAFRYHLIKLHMNGKAKDNYDELIDDKSTQDFCEAEIGEYSPQLTVSSMSGILIIHAGVLLIAAVILTIAHLKKKTGADKEDNAVKESSVLSEQNTEILIKLKAEVERIQRMLDPLLTYERLQHEEDDTNGSCM